MKEVKGALVETLARKEKIVCVLKEFGLFMEQRLHITKANCAEAAGVV